MCSTARLPVAFTSAMVERGIEVLELHDLLADVLALPTARAWDGARMFGSAQTAKQARVSINPVAVRN